MAKPSNPLARYLNACIKEDLANKMVFLGGPRQVGKTTLALSLLGTTSTRHPAYLNWDAPQVRSRVLQGELPGGQDLIVLDEVHKFPRWKNLVKGIYDTSNDLFSLLVTGSARLDHYRKGGDSLQGRYHHYRLHPFSLGELTNRASPDDVDTLLRFGGFPEPLLVANARVWRRWQSERLSRVVYEDVRDLENVREVALIELLIGALPVRVGSPLSILALSEDLQVSHQSVVRWLEILERLYVCHRIPPFGAPRIRAVKKENKLYLWDWSQVPEAGPRFENLVAGQLLKYCHFQADTQGYAMELRYIRDTDGREVDFVVLRDGRPMFAVECKVGEREVSRSLTYFKARVPIPRWYQVHLGETDRLAQGVRILPFARFCDDLNMP